MLSVAKHLGCIQVSVYEIFRFAQNDNGKPSSTRNLTQKLKLMEQPNRKPKTVWGIVLKVIITVATAVAGAFGLSSCL